MVYLKVSDGSETRKLQVTPGEVSFDQLREQLATLFPKTVNGETHGLSLQYRDTDGDVITLSSDQELQLALSDVEENGVWKVYIKNTGSRPGGGSLQSSEDKRQRSKRRSPCSGGALFQHLFEPSLKRRRLFTSVWDDLEEQLRLLHLLQDDVFSSDVAKTDQSRSSKDSTRETTSEGDPLASTEKQDKPVAKDADEEVRSKPEPADAVDSDKRKGNNVDGKEPQWETRKFVTWEPRLQVGPFGFFHSHMTPVVYKVSFKSSTADSGCCQSGDCEKTTESKEEASSTATDRPVETEKQTPPTAASDEAATQAAESATVTAE